MTAGVPWHVVTARAMFIPRVGNCTKLAVSLISKDLDDGTETFARRLAIKRGQTMKDLHFEFGPLTERLWQRAATATVRTQGGLGHPMTVPDHAVRLRGSRQDSVAGACYGDVRQGCPFYPCHALMALRRQGTAGPAWRPACPAPRDRTGHIVTPRLSTQG